MKYTFTCPWISQRSTFPNLAKVARNCFVKTVLPVGKKIPLQPQIDSSLDRLFFSNLKITLNGYGAKI